VARLDYQGLDEVLDSMKRAGELIGPTADKMLQAGAEELSKSWVSAIKKHSLIKTGDMVNSVAPNKIRTTGGVRLVDVYPQGKDRKGVRNAEKAFVLHYGTTRIKATRLVDDVEDGAEEPIQRVYERIWDEHLKEI
jgi:hypothetical protein